MPTPPDHIPVTNDAALAGALDRVAAIVPRHTDAGHSSTLWPSAGAEGARAVGRRRSFRSHRRLLDRRARVVYSARTAAEFGTIGADLGFRPSNAKRCVRRCTSESSRRAPESADPPG